MNDDTNIELCGPFMARDSDGNQRNIEAVRIFDEGYGIIDVYVHLSQAFEANTLYSDTTFVGHVMRRLKELGYAGPAFGHGDLGLQDDRLVVLEAPEAFNSFAASRGWKNLAEEFLEDEPETAGASASSPLLDALMRKFKAS